MKYILITLTLILSIYAKDFSIVIDKPFNSALFDIVEDYDRTISAVGFSSSYEATKADTTAYTNAFDYLSSISSGHGTQMHLLKVDNQANLLVDKLANLAKYNEAIALVKTPQNGYIIGGYTLDGSLLISKLNANGKLIFTKTFGTKNHDVMNNIILLKDGGILTIGSSSTSRSSQDNIFETGLGLNDIYITRFTKDGRKLWGKKYGTQYDDRGLDAVEARDGSIVIVGTTEYDAHKNITLLRVTGDGDKVWIKHYKEKNFLTPYKIIKLRDNNFLLSLAQENEIKKKQIRLIKFNLQRDILIDKEIYTSYSSVLRDIKEYSDGGIIGVGYVKDTYNTNALVMLLDSALNMTHQEHFGAQNYDAFNAVTILHNSQAAVAGINTSEESQESNMWIVKLNRDATVVQLSTKIESFYTQLQRIFKQEIDAKKLLIKENLSIEIVDSSLLFKQGVYKLTKPQEEFLTLLGKKLIPFLNANREFISTLEINGHTSSEWGGTTFSSNYLNNEKLSMNRSYATLSYLFKEQTESTQMWLSRVLRGSGFASSKQVTFDNKVENKIKSRRVVFKILLNEKK
ncbi:MAG: outer membrane protein OmpA-like peptidoglycan-associated protein [Sulfurimonas sp.]|jgi:outer membrane protein OmpA-like peptidoglycan-associated protein|uniref:hypothetical protein n=1 Tax=Sulfurimonas sp. TaxID=2022749 RepID=UPI0039E6F521